MNRTKKIIAGGAIALAMATSALLFTPVGSNASGNVVLASVDWVASQLNPLKTKIADDEKKLESQQQQINDLRAQLVALRAALPVPPKTPVTPPKVILPKPVTPPKIITPKPVTPSKVITTKAVILRKGSSDSFAPAGKLPAGITVKFLTSVVNSKGEKWLNIETAMHIKGWMLSTTGEVK